MSKKFSFKPKAHCKAEPFTHPDVAIVVKAKTLSEAAAKAEKLEPKIVQIDNSYVKGYEFINKIK